MNESREIPLVNSKTTCLAPECQRSDIKARGLCNRHYAQLLVYGQVFEFTQFDRRPAIMTAIRPRYR